ncbi:MAG: YHYH protein [Flavobacterium sp.]
MKKIVLFLGILIFQNAANAQAGLTSWIMNAGEYASYWQNTNGNPTNPSFVFYTSTALANIKKVCYNDTYIWTQSEGMTTNMGQFLNPGAPTAQGYTYRFPRNPTVPATKTISPIQGAIGLLTNGVPVYGLSNAHYYNGTNNNGMGPGGTWNVEVYLSEGFVLDATLGAHPQQQGAYHSHAKPYRLYSGTDSTVHSPIIGWAFDGYPIYGPYGYSNPTDATSAVTRMKTGYSLRNITTRTTLPYGVALNSSQYGPAVSNTYPLGTYIEDYNWLASNGGDLDKYNGRFCVTPEFPAGTYAYFVTVNASGTPQFPYYIGIEYYGAPETDDITPNAAIAIPTSGTSCFTTALGVEDIAGNQSIYSYPNPSNGIFNLVLPDLNGDSKIEIFTISGSKVFEKKITGNQSEIDISNIQRNQLLLLKVSNNGNQYNAKLLLN